MGSIQINNSVGSMMNVLYEGHTQYSNKDEIVWLESEYSFYLLWLDLIWGEGQFGANKSEQVNGSLYDKDKEMQKTEIHVKDRIEILEKSERYVILFDWCI
jgi:hypothetical protein